METILKFTKTEARVYIEKNEAPKSPVRTRLTYSGETERFGFVHAEASCLPNDTQFVGTSMIHAFHHTGRSVYMTFFDRGLQKLQKVSPETNTTLQIPFFHEATNFEELVGLNTTISCSVKNVSSKKRSENPQAFLKVSAAALELLKQLQQPTTVCIFIKDPPLQNPDENNA